MPDGPTPYDLHPSVAYVQSVLANLTARTGRDLQAWMAAARAGAPADPKARLAWLKAQGLGGTQAGLVLQRLEARPGQAFDDTPAGYLAAAPGYVDAQFAGRKAPLRPRFESLVAVARSLGPDVKVCPCATLVPFYRNHVFAQVKPFTARLDLGLALGDPAAVADPEGRLHDTGGFARKDRITHKLELTATGDLDLARIWLRQAYQRAGEA